MKIRVLAPIEAKKFFLQSDSLDIDPIFYHLSGRRPGPKMLGAFRTVSASSSVDSYLTVDENNLDDVRAAWLSPRFSLDARQMGIFLDRLPALQWVYSQRTGTDHLNRALFEERGIAVSNTGDMVSRWVAEMVTTAILAHAKHLITHIELQRKGLWRTVYCDELATSTVAVIGTGNIGTRVAKMCRNLGMRVLGASRSAQKFENLDHPFSRVYSLERELPDLIGASDFIVLSLPLTERTKHFIAEKEFSLMQPNAVLINYARSALVHGGSLLRALRKKRIAAYYSDFAPEVSRWQRFQLRRMPGLLITHNSSAHFREKPKLAFDQFVRNLSVLDEPDKLRNRVV